MLNFSLIIQIKKEKSMKRLILLPVLLLLTTSALAVSSQEVEILDPFAREVRAGQKNSAVFMQLKNTSSKDHMIISATSNASSVVELHTHINDNGVMRMRKIPEIKIPANSTTDLKPGGLHIMLINLYQGLSEGMNVEVEIEFADGSKSVIDAPVKKVMGMGMKHHGQKGMGHHGKKGNKGHHKKGHSMNANPMPNLMKVIKKHGDKLALSEGQKSKLAEWRTANHDKVHGLMKNIRQSEKELNAASLAGADKATLLAKADEIMDMRKAIIATKTDCRDNLKTVLTDKQYSQVIEIYKSMGKKQGKHHKKGKMH